MIFVEPLALYVSFTMSLLRVPSQVWRKPSVVDAAFAAYCANVPTAPECDGVAAACSGSGKSANGRTATARPYVSDQ